MKLLLDTHIWLWCLSQPERISSRVSSELCNAENEIWLSPISIGEFVVLCEKGRVEASMGVESWLREALRKFPVREAVLTQEVALETHRVAMEHRDPADRYLAATARVYGLTVVTNDERLLRVKGLTTLANR